MSNMTVQESIGRRVDDQHLDIMSGAQVETGSIDVGWLPAGAVIDLRQVRESYDPAELQELADRIPYDITPEGVIHLKLQHPPAVNVFHESQRDELEQYILDHADYYEGDVAPISIDSLPQTDGAWHLRINGHRRGLAIKLRCEQLGIPFEDSNVRISYSFRRAITFQEALQEQIVENTSAHIPPEQDARSIARHKRWLMTHNLSSSNAEIARFFGYGEEKVANALRFVTMPDSITQFLGDGLTYGNIVQLARLRDAYLAADKRTPTEKMFEDLMVDEEATQWSLGSAQERMEHYFEMMLFNRFKDLSSAHINNMVRAKIAEVTRLSSYSTGELFIMDEGAEVERARKKTRRGITGMALKALHYLNSSGHDIEVSPEDAEILLELYMKATKASDEASVQQLLELGD